MPAPTRRKIARPPLGQARQSQVLQLYGPGAMVDLPDYALLIGGLDLWSDKGCDIVYEPRLLQLVRQATGVAHLDLKTPPKEVDRLKNISGSIKAFRFPEWSVAQKVSERLAFDSIPCRARPLVHFNDGCIQDWRRYRDDEGEYPLVPVRFVTACPHGHLSDIPWRDFCFRQFNCQNTERLYLLEAGTGNDFTQIYVQSDSGVTRKLADALVTQSNSLGNCQSRTPWLGRGRFDSETCITDGKRTRNRLLVRSASNAYFTETLSVISLPEDVNGLAKRVCELKDDLGGIGAETDVPAALKFNPRLKSAFTGVDPALLWQEIEAQRGGPGTEAPSPKDEELKLFVGPMDGVSSSSEDSLFEADVWQTSDAPTWYRKAIQRVLLVHRLREVQALVGFTRFTPRTSSLGGLPIDTTSSNCRAPLANNLTWVPASENKGEGIFIELDPHRIRAWAGSDAVTMRTMNFMEAFEREWLATRGLSAEQFPFPGAPYLLLHSLSHLLITEIALECGYGASSIRERIYANSAIGYGILLFTSSSGSEGTLGGLVEAGKRIVTYLEKAFERGQLCSNDPFCSEHDPNHHFDIRPTHGAACHGCELIAETSCERHNEFLDRALVSPTVSAAAETGDPSFWSFINTGG
ncbi:MAG: DUF1998 domain-containing protein [Synechococcus sp. SB0673_bin_10]|uniref:DUF1998 domain-containing protein n=1 Tax=Synechococcus sp. SB0676_bin_10 TaxID=2604869 RepID=A0A6B1F8Y7_9SYNE|nr:DUF1998 domain-containing protein [Cyanobacteria bacterium MAG IRC3_bin_20]MDE0646683.1 DUF1998 domain-containing protein [Cyanobacteria bacterium MAG IRC4_bin_6]MXY19616.1 DUF1998 domain-containing protein [Synechococcus sp. SB0664_bin_36]MYG38185.1 DUF1998 domain-containing protein [Synechococcus sp. SB0676_bin_10]MYI72186.1 DUF1998 domain-containing protein [Synechococcus sp. SB0673_bin_10]